MQYVIGYSDAQIIMNIYNRITEMSYVKPSNQGFTISSQRISTHILTVLTIGAILQLEQRRRSF